jgi:serine/threonine-protein kinase RsbW
MSDFEDSSRSHEDDRVVELRLPSRLGYEKVAMDAATAMGRRMGFNAERIDSLRTAISEAVTNAIEHGNAHDSDMKVFVVLTMRDDGLMVNVTDQGRKRLEPPPPLHKPDLRAVMGQSEKGGWGIWLIKELVDEVQFSVDPSGGNQVSMIIHLER